MSGIKMKIAKDINKLKKFDGCEVLKDSKSLVEPLVIRIEIKDEETVIKYDWEDQKDEGLNPYFGGYFIVEIYLGETYPDTAPIVIFRTPIIHANIDQRDGYILLRELSKWDPDEKLD